MSLVLRSEIGRRISIAEMDGNFTYLQQLAISGTTSVHYSQVTYSELISTIDSSSLNPGSYYLITDFKTCYDQPDYNIYGSPITEGNYKVGNTHSILVFATSETTLSTDAWQPDFPKDRIKYDFSWTQSERTGGTAYGRITERIDEWNNRTDYDHRDILFKRYDTFSYQVNTPQAGTISVSSGVVTGEDTVFTNFSVGDIIAIPNFSELFFKIDSISGATAMSLTGSFWDVTGNDLKYYSLDYTMYRCSYKKNNVDNVSYEISTFGDAIENSVAFNNYIGDNANGYYFGEIGEFLLSNNVFLQGSYYNNKFGNNCYNNTFDGDCTGNTIGNFFNRNITDDDFGGNNIGNNFESNLITSNFQRNIVGENFTGNYIVVGSFYRNKISEQFENNKISGNDFQNNIIGNAFNNNQIDSNGDGFLKNIIGVGFHSNIINGEFNSNTFGNGGNNNNFYGSIYENKIGDYFEYNNLGYVSSTIQFYENHIGNNFDNNNIYRNFYQNRIFIHFNNNDIYDDFDDNFIDNGFENNTIGSADSIGNYDFQGNKIGYDSKGNFFRGYVYDNILGHGFYSNDVHGDFNGNVFGSVVIFNTFGTNSQNNNIGNFFISNDIGEDFINNHIQNSFSDNNISFNFSYNEIGNNFYNNNIENDFGFGGDQSYGNKIGNYFENNTIGEYFYGNVVTDIFNNNTVGSYFRFNDAKIHNLGSYDFTIGYNNIISFTDNTGASPSIPGTDNVYTGLTVSGGSGSNATFDVTVSGSIVTDVSLNNSGTEYQLTDVLTIPYQSFGGTSGLDIEITVGSVSATPHVYQIYNCTLFRNASATYSERLSYYDENDVLNIESLYP